ncbi:MAG: hypothetical protein MJZ74_00260 [Muribaculaceae bacterium]|nr:hypothetical protein [Muribaculaceae bacterium]
MKTKIVYVVTSLDSDIYMDQAIVSAWSAHHHNPGCCIEMVCDQDTYATLNSGVRAQYKYLFDAIYVYEFKPEQGMMERSRWLKTTLREIIEGDFLYLDTDTVVCADLSYVDDFDFDLGMVQDCNCDFNQCLIYDWVVPVMKKMYGIDVSKETVQFNGGVAFVRDCEMTHEFYRRWNELWVHSMREFKRMKDQQPLMKANIDMGYVVKEMSGNLNCQVAESIQYLHTAHVMHFFNNLLGKTDDMSPLFNELYVKVKAQGLTDELKETILNCKSSFMSPSMPVPREGAMLWRKHLSESGKHEEMIQASNTYHALLFMWLRLPRFTRFIDKILGKFIRKSHKKE